MIFLKQAITGIDDPDPFQDFCMHNKGDLVNNADARRVFELLIRPDSIVRMEAVSDLGMPAIWGIVQDIQEMLKDSKEFSISRGDEEKTYPNRQMIGKMVAYVMKQIGYEKDPSIETNLDPFTRLPHIVESDFGNGLVYKQNGKGRYDIALGLIEL